MKKFACRTFRVKMTVAQTALTLFKEVLTINSFSSLYLFGLLSEYRSSIGIIMLLYLFANLGRKFSQVEKHWLFL